MKNNKPWLKKEDWDFYQSFKYGSSGPYLPEELSELKETFKNPNMSKLSYIPYGKNILVEVPKEDKIFFGKTALIDPSTLSDKERVNLGFSTKSAEIANKSSEEQREYKVVAVGPKVDPEEVKIGDFLLFKPAVQSITIDVDGEMYIQAEEFWVAGKMLRK